MMTWVNRCMIVKAESVVVAKLLCKELSGWSDMFEVGLSASGLAPATHFISNGLIEKDFADLLSSPGDIYALAVQRGVPVTLEQIQSVLADSTVVDQPAREVMSSLGLQLIN